MKPPNAPAHADDPRDLAAAWFAHLHGGHASAQDRHAFEQWYQAHPEHARQYRHVQHIWEATLQVPEAELRALLARADRPASRPSLARRRFGLGLTGVCCAALVGGVALQQGWLAQPQQVVDITAPRGERRQVTLPDGSVLEVNTGTRAQARWFSHRREITLTEGEIFFAVQPDAHRPFIVHAGASRVVVTGTRFNVRHDAERVQVSVESGAVEVSGGPWWHREVQQLTANQGVEVRTGETPGAVRPVELGSLLAWRRGKIVFENTPLAQAVDEINRYLPEPARLDAPSLRGHRVAGIFSVDEPQALIDMLPEFAPVTVYRLANGQFRIVAR